MTQLLNISITNAEIRLNIQNAKAEYKTSQPTLKINRQKGDIKISKEPLQIHIDSSKVRESIGLKKVDKLVEDYGQAGKEGCIEAIKNYVRQGNTLADPNGIKVSQLAKMKLKYNNETYLDFIPKDKPEISFTGGKLDYEYVPDKISYETPGWMEFDIDYKAGNVSLEMISKPQVDVTYTGMPRYINANTQLSYAGTYFNTIV